EGQVTEVQATGSHNTAFNPVLMAIAAGAGFVARAFSGEKEHLIEVMKQAIQYDGYALVDILQPCVSFNKVNTFAYYKQRVYKLGKDYDRKDKLGAIQKALEPEETIPIGVIYEEKKLTFHQKNEVLAGGVPLAGRATDLKLIQKYMDALQ
ncbi:MAG: 2-oxoacid ferredoxin oxidoreductase, partial [Clostridia bacterium]